MVSASKTSPWQVTHKQPRTQTKIKNYFYGKIRFFLKLITKIILRVNTGFIGDIKTDVLLDIYEASNSNYYFNQNFKVFLLFNPPLENYSIKLRRSPARGSFDRIEKPSNCSLDFLLKITH
jgi:hypothetical protein